MYDNFQALTAEDFSRWLTPPQAIGALSHLKMEDAARQIWKRLEHDVMKAVAARIVFPNGHCERAIVPSEWWRLDAPLVKLGFWDTGDIELAQSSGSYGIPDKLVAALFGVRFDPAGIAELAPPPFPSAAIAEQSSETHEESPSAAEFEQWLRPSEALQRLPSPWLEETRKRAIVRRLAEGHIRATARSSTYEDTHKTISGDYLPVPQYLWAVPWKASDTDFWTVGDIQFSLPPSLFDVGAPILVTEDGVIDGNQPVEPELYAGGDYLDVRLNPGDFDEQFGSGSQPVVARAKSGRPPAPWWDDLWIEIARQLYAGDLDHHSQAALEKAMHDWITANGHEAGETTVRRRAQRLFQALNREDQN